jgi:hypothetical protein
LFKPFWLKIAKSNCYPTHSGQETGHGGSKILRKHEAETAHSADRARGACAAHSLSFPHMMNNIDTTADFGRATPIYEVLTTMGKDGAGERSTIPLSAHARPIFTRFSIDQGVTGGNGEQPCRSK